MNSFEPANLSPRAKTRTECPLPYSLTWDDLLPILPGYADPDGAKAQAFNSFDKQGLNGGDNSCILTLNYPAGKNNRRSETVFIKRAVDLKKAEAQKYHFIASRGIPTPRLLAVIQKDKAEIIVLEFLAGIGIVFHSQFEVTELLHLVAKLNAIQNPPDLFIPAPGLPQDEFDKLVKAALVAMSGNQILDADSWFGAYQAAQMAAKSMPQAINHNEFYFQQVGWAQRENKRELVIFDLETMAMRPRFTDVAAILYPLAVYSGREQVELFQIYLDQLRLYDPLLPDFSTAFREFRFLRIVDLCETLPWLVDSATHAGAVVMNENLLLTMTCLKADLTTLRFL